MYALRPGHGSDMKPRLLLLLSPLLTATLGCAVEKSDNPLSPTVAGPIPGVEITAPRVLEPNGNMQIAANAQPLTLLLENAYTTGPRPLNYLFEVASDANFANKVFQREGVEPGQGGRTSLRLPDALGTGRSYFWRALAQDGANTGPYSSPGTFVVYTPVAFDKPQPISPADNITSSDNVPDFSFRNAPRVGNPGPITYVIEISTSIAFTTINVAWTVAEQPNITKLTSPGGLPGSTQLYWRVRAYEATAIGPWSDIATFRTPTPVVVAPSPSPGIPPGGSCSSFSQPFQIVDCRRKQYSTIPHDQLVVFLRAVASDLNKAGIAGGPFGLLRKTGGANCGGYSCDILCAGNGGSQRQWDILGDVEGAQTPAWIGPKSGSEIRVDSCEVQ